MENIPITLYGFVAMLSKEDDDELADVPENDFWLLPFKSELELTFIALFALLNIRSAIPPMPEINSLDRFGFFCMFAWNLLSLKLNVASKLFQRLL